MAFQEPAGHEARPDAAGHTMSKRDDIAQRVLGKVQQRSAAAEPPRPRVMSTFIGQVGQQMTAGFAARVEELERERREGFVILALDPKAIRRSDQANRHALSLAVADADFAALKDSLRRDGQIMPVSVRLVAGDPQHAYELVSGHRRHEAALQLDRERPDGFELRAVLDTAAQEPAKLALHMYLENAARKDLRPTSWGRCSGPGSMARSSRPAVRSDGHGSGQGEHHQVPAGRGTTQGGAGCLWRPAGHRGSLGGAADRRAQGPCRSGPGGGPKAGRSERAAGT